MLVGLICLVFSVVSATISEEKCNEYSRQFSQKKIRVTRHGDGNELREIEAGFGEFPHVAVLTYMDVNGSTWQGCGGSLISDQFVLTTASCLNPNESSTLKSIRLGELDLESEEDDSTVQEFNVTEVLIYPGYKPNETYHDIALLKLDRRVNITENIRPACLHPEFSIAQNQQLPATSWGLRAPRKSPTLKKTHPQPLTPRECSRFFNSSTPSLPYGILDKLLICADSNDSTSDPGSALQVLSVQENVYQIIGLAISEGNDGHVLFTRVAAYVPWIENIIWYCEESNLSPLEIDFLITATNAAPRPFCKQEVKDAEEIRKEISGDESKERSEEKI